MAQGFDREAYLRDVLDVARRSPGLPDLMTRYAVPASAELDAVAFHEHLDVVVKYWRGLRQRRQYKPLADRLLVAHSVLQENRQLSYKQFQEDSERHRQAVQKELETLLQALAGQGPVTRARLDLLLIDLTGTVPEAVVGDVLASLGIRVVDAWELPPAPSGQVLQVLRDNLRVLGLELAAEVVLGTEEVRAGFRIREGFRLRTGVIPAPELIRAAVDDLARKPHDNRRTSAENILSSLLNAAGAPGRLDALLLWQLVQLLQPLAARKAPVQVIAGQARELGLDEDEATELALTLADQAQDPAEETRRAVHVALGDGQLREAQRLVPALPASDPLRKTVDEQAEAVTRRVREADAALAEGRPDEAAELLTRAIRVADDDPEITAKLRNLPPPPPTAVWARPEGEQVLLGWDPSEGYAGGLNYVVVRLGRGPADDPRTADRVTETGGVTAVDPAPPFGERLHYAVLATRGGAWSEPATATAEPAAPEVADLRLVTRDLAVYGAWRRHPKAHGVVVLRAEGAPPPPSAAARALPSTPSDFEDTEVVRDHRYFYRVRSVYLTRTGQQYLSQGVIADVVPAEAPAAVLDLTVLEQPGDRAGVRLSWTEPPAGQVQVRLDAVPHEEGDALVSTVHDISLLGEPLPGRVRESGGRAVLDCDLPPGRSYLTAVTVAGDLAVAGPSVPFAMVEPVGRLRCRRVGDRLALTWTWPDGIFRCRVEWDGRSVECGRRRYLDEGGLTIEAGPQPVTVSVSSVLRDREGETVSRPATARVEGAPAVIRYTVRRGRVLRRGRAVVTFTCDRSARLPPTTVVHSGGSVRPLSHDKGSVLARVEEQDIGPTLPVVLTVAVPRGFGPCWVAAFADEPADDRAVLIAAGRG